MTTIIKKNSIPLKPILSSWDTVFKTISSDTLARNYILSICFSDDFFTYAVSEHKSNKIIGSSYYKKITLVKIIIQDNILSKSYKQVRICYSPSQYTIIPNELFDAKLIKDYLKFNMQNPELDFVTFDNIAKCKSKLVYSMPRDIAKWIKQYFPKANLFHQNTSFLNYLLNTKNTNTKPEMHVHISTYQINITVIQQNKLLFCNVFDTQTIDEQVYFIAFTMEQLKLSLLSTKIFFSNTPDYDISQTKILFKYFNKPDFADYQLNLSNSLKKIKASSFNNLYCLSVCE